MDRRTSLDLVADLGLDNLDLNLFPLDFNTGGQSGGTDAVADGDFGGGQQFQFDDGTFDFGMDFGGSSKYMYFCNCFAASME